MSKFIKIFLCVVSVCILLICGLGFYAFKSLKSITPKAEQLVSEALGRKVNIGNIDVKLFPEIKLVINKVKVPENESDKQKNYELPSTESLDLRINFLSLLKLSPSATLVLNQPVITALKTAKGISIYGIKVNSRKRIEQNKKKENLPTSKKISKKSPESGFLPEIDLNIDSLSINDGNFRIIDKTNNINAILKNFNFRTAFKVKNNTKIHVDHLELDTIEDRVGKLAISLDSAELSTNPNAPIDLENLIVSLAGMDLNLSAKGKLKDNQILISNLISTIEFEKITRTIKALLPDISTKLEPYGLKGLVRANLKSVSLSDILNTNSLKNSSEPITGTINIKDLGASLPNNTGINNSSVELELLNFNNTQRIKLDSILKVFSPLLSSSSENLEVTVSEESKLNIADKELDLSNISIIAKGIRLILNSAKINLNSGDGAVVIGPDSIVNIKDTAGIVKATENLKTDGKASLKGLINISQFSNISGNSDISLENIKYELPIGILENLNGIVNAKIISPTNLKITSEDLKANLNKELISLTTDSTITVPTLKLNSTEINLADGSITGNGSYNLNSAKFAGNFKGNSLNLNKAVKLLGMSKSLPTISGKLRELSSNITGTLGESLFQSLNGGLNFEVKDTLIKEINIAAQVIDGINNLSFISGLVKKQLPAEFSQYLKGSDTHVESLSFNSIVTNGRAKITLLDLVSDIFTLKGSGNMLLPTRDLDLKTNFIFSQEFTSALTNRIKEVKRLVGNDDNLNIPLKISGDIPKVIITPNFNKLLQQGAKNAIKDKASEFLGKILSKDKSKNKSGSKKQNIGKNLVEGILSNF